MAAESGVLIHIMATVVSIAATWPVMQYAKGVEMEAAGHRSSLGHATPFKPYDDELKLISPLAASTGTRRLRAEPPERERCTRDYARLVFKVQ